MQIGNECIHCQGPCPKPKGRVCWSIKIVIKDCTQFVDNLHFMLFFFEMLFEGGTLVQSPIIINSVINKKQ